MLPINMSLHIDESSDMRSPTWQYYTACFIGEGVYGCFKDKILCGVDYELLPLKLSTGKQAHMDENDHQRQQQQPKGDCIFIGPACIESDIVCLPSTQNNCPMPILQQVSIVTVIKKIFCMQQLLRI